AEATFARSLSGHTGLRAAAADLPGPTPVRARDTEGLVDAVEQALFASKIVAYAQGFHQIQAGSDEYGWGIDLAAMATIWRGGCIIRAEFLDHIRVAYDDDPGLATLLTAPYFADALAGAQAGWRRVVSLATELGIP